MSFFNRKYWRLMLLIMVFATCSVGGCQEYFQELTYGEGSPGVTPEEYKREQDQAIDRRVLEKIDGIGKQRYRADAVRDAEFDGEVAQIQAGHYGHDAA